MILQNRMQLLRHVAADRSFTFRHARDEQPNPGDHLPHYEHGYEIYLFLSGEGTYTIEGCMYSLEPYALLIMNPNELHVLHISEQSPYERIVITLQETFLPPFLTNGVDFFRGFKFRPPGHGNKIDADTVRNGDLLPLLVKLEHLLEKPNAEHEFVARCVLVQLLAAINRIVEQGGVAQSQHHVSPKIAEALEFINSHLSEDLHLDQLAERLYVSKFHLCRLFKKETGYSINQYIHYKRIRLADQLMQEGYSPTQACYMTGFNSYSNFYKTYRKLTGTSPRTYGKRA